MAKKITDEQLAEAVSKSFSIREVLKHLGIKFAGGSHSHYTKRIKKANIDISHFTGQKSMLGKVSYQRKTSSEILILRNNGIRADSKKLVRSLIEIGRKHECEKCGQGTEWMGNPLTLDVDHINENWLDDRAENLRFLCPNCHSQFSRGLIRECGVI